MQLATMIEVMRQPQFYPHQPAKVEVVQTHISCVFLADELVYKIKKPVRFSFLDFSTLELRRFVCHEEVRLNRRLAGSVYLGVRSLFEDRGELHLGSEDDPRAIEYTVVMRRLPQQRLLDHLLEHNEVSDEMIDRLAARLADFHSKAACRPEITANGSRDGIARILADNFSNGRRFRGVTLDPFDDDAIQKFAQSFLGRNGDRLRRRQEENRIRECHGDLHSEHVCFDEPLVIFDCIEFNTQFRYIDIASDIAFLAMDLDYHGRHDLSELFLERYRMHSGDHEAAPLIAFYACYRAYVRGKVDSLKSLETELAEEERQAAAASARHHFELAYRYTWSQRSALVVVGGLSGTGKSAVASHLAARTGFAHINSDIVRKQLAGLSPTTRHSGTYEGGIYTPELSERTYATMFNNAEKHLADGRGVILDATFQLRRGRDQARTLAARLAVPLLFVECVCNPTEVEARLRARHTRNDDPSDADWNVYQQQRLHYEPFSADETADRLMVDTGASNDPCGRRIEERLRIA